jgi:hypothetical protein
MLCYGGSDGVSCEEMSKSLHFIFLLVWKSWREWNRR